MSIPKDPGNGGGWWWPSQGVIWLHVDLFIHTLRQAKTTGNSITGYLLLLRHNRLE